MDQFTKQPSERFYIQASIYEAQTAEDAIVLGEVAVTAQDRDGGDASAVVLDPSSLVLASDPRGSFTDNVVGIRVRNGTQASSPYKITFRMPTQNGDLWEKDVWMIIREA